MRYINIFKLFLKINFIKDMQYRAHFITQIALMFVNSIISLINILILMKFTPSIGGWDKTQMLLLQGIIWIVDSIFGGLFFFSLIRVPKSIQNYDIDFILLKPINNIFYVSMRYMNFGILFGAVWGIVLIIFVTISYSIPAVNLLWFVFQVIPSILIIYSIFFFIITMSLRFIKVNGLIQMFWSIMELGKNPAGIYKLWLNHILVLVIPVLVIYNYPVNILWNGFNWSYIGMAMIAAIVLVTASSYFWKKSIASIYQ
ncbi:ABC-2 family transporter protein [Alkaliphilus sp. B6464]|uniref:ABC-2 family transporter protein n=1 Tax=Alkaliphilus sp. B6464 TaxID=2731219 RepID=UPI001BAD1F4A|nr:ABC-2 family transporter protein [Alkaliphilus sp. B6464]QUH19298.1 ABC-2 family transporter protein [Alkaliphilus sp. B6464]